MTFIYSHRLFFEIYYYVFIIFKNIKVLGKKKNIFIDYIMGDGGGGVQNGKYIYKKWNKNVV